MNREELGKIQDKLLSNILGEKNPTTMNREEWLKGLAEGKRYTHAYFTSSEWVQASAVPEHLEFEDGVLCSIEEFERYRENWPHNLWEEIEK